MDAPQKSSHFCGIGDGGPVPPGNGLKCGGDAVGNVAVSVAKPPGKKADATGNLCEAVGGIDAAAFLRGQNGSYNVTALKTGKGSVPDMLVQNIQMPVDFFEVVGGLVAYCFSNHCSATNAFSFSASMTASLSDFLTSPESRPSASTCRA